MSATRGVLIETTGNLGSADVTLLRASATTSGQYGFDIRYMGSRSGNNNSFALEMHNQLGTNVEAITVLQDGKVGINNTSPGQALDVTGSIAVGTAIELGHASDTTLARSSAGVATIEGVEITTNTASQTLTNKTLTNPTINAFSGTGDGSITGNLSVSSKIDAGILEGKGGVTYDPPGSSGTDTATDVAIAVHSGDRIVLGDQGYIRTIVDAEWGSALIIGQSGTGAFAGTEIYGGNAGVTLKHSTNTKFATTSTGATLTGALSITNTSTDDSLLITTTEDSSTAAPVITLKRNSSSPADADYLGQLKFKGENDADQEVIYAKITGKIQDASDGSEDGLIEFANKKAGSNVITARLRSDSFQLLNSTNLSVAGTTTLTGNVSLEAQADLQFYDSDSSHYVGFQAPATITSSVLWTLPNTDGTDGQIIKTDGAGTLSWTDNSGGGGSGSSFPNSTFTTCPASDGNDFDLSFNVAQTAQETPFEASGTDAFGVNLGSVFSLMDPVGQTDGPFDMGALT